MKIADFGVLLGKDAKKVLGTLIHLIEEGMNMKAVLILITVAIAILLIAVVITYVRFQKGDSDLMNSKNKKIDTQKKCKSCRQLIHASATVCQHCNQRQYLFGRFFGEVAIAVSIVMVLLATAQFLGALKKNADASKALKTANSTVDQLQNIACINAELALTDSMAATFMGGVDLKARLDLNDKLIDGLIEIGVSEEKVKDIKKMWSKGIGMIYHRGIRNALEGRTDSNMLNMEASPELRKASKEFQETMNFKQWEVLRPDEMKSFIEEKGVMNDTVRELISDYRYFLETGNIRRRSVFEQL